MSKEEVVINQIVLAIIRAYQATSVSRAIKLSEPPIHPLYLHIDNTQYFSIVNDISKIFDKSGDNLISLIKLNKSKIKNEEYDKLINEVLNIQKKYKSLLAKINNHRNKFSSHIDGDWIYDVVRKDSTSNLEIDLKETQEMLKELISLIDGATFVSKEIKVSLKKRIKPKDAQDILGLKTNIKVIQEILKSFYNAN